MLEMLFRSFLPFSAALFLLIADAKPDEKPTVKIGVILPLTGDLAAVGAACRDAVRMAVQDQPQTNIFNYKIVFDDDRLTPAEVARAAHKLISVDKVSALVSTWSYGGQIVSPLASRAHIPHIGVAWDHTVAVGDYNFLHLTPPSEFMRRFLDVFRKLQVKRVALLGIEESGSVFALDEFIRLAPDYEVNVVFRDSVLWDLKDFNSLVSKISSSNPEYLIFNIGGEALSTPLLRAINSQRAKFKYTAITSFDVIEDTSLIEGLWYVSDSFLPEDFGDRFEKEYGHKIRYGVGNFYEAVRLLIYAFEKSGKIDPAQVKDVLMNIKEQPSIFGPTSVDENGIFTYPARYLRIVNGKRILIDLDQIQN